MRIILLLVVVPLVELALLIKLYQVTSLTFTIAVTLFTGILGASLARRQGFSTIRRIQSEMSSGRVPATAIVDAVMILIAGLLLMTPGILTDVFGFSLLVPAIRRVYRNWATNWFRKNVRVQSYTSTTRVQPSETQPEIIDSYVVPHDEPADGRPKEQRSPGTDG